MKIGFIGAGNMGLAFIKGILLSGAAIEEDVTVFDKNIVRQNEICAKHNIAGVLSAEEIAEFSEIIFLAVKPHQIVDVLREIQETVRLHAPLVVSMAAGKTIAHICNELDPEARVVRVMPNVNVEYSYGMCAYTCNSNVTEYDKLELEKCLLAVGRRMELNESLFDAFTAIAGCGPAFAYIFCDALANAGLKLGLDKSSALEIAAQTLFGSAAAMLTSDDHPRRLVDKVCSPGGATINGVASLLSDRFDHTVMSAVEAAYNKTKEL